MSTPCSDYRDRLLPRVDASESTDSDVARHLETCPSCAAAAARHARTVELLREIPRCVAPAELPGRVVSACHAGYRQDRIVAMIRRLTRGLAPAELARKVLERKAADEHGHGRVRGVRAPDALDRRIAEDLADPSAAVARRFASRLARVPAPDELEARVDRSLRKRASLVSLTPRMRLVRRAAMATAALFAACVGTFVWIREANQEPAPRYRFEVRRVTNLASMDPMAQSLVSGLSGGLLLPGQPKSDDPK